MGAALIFGIKFYNVHPAEKEEVVCEIIDKYSVYRTNGRYGGRRVYYLVTEEEDRFSVSGKVYKEYEVGNNIIITYIYRDDELIDKRIE